MDNESDDMNRDVTKTTTKELSLLEVFEICKKNRENFNKQVEEYRKEEARELSYQEVCEMCKQNIENYNKQWEEYTKEEAKRINTDWEE